MDVIEVEGGYPIQGTITVEGAKNSALKLMAATIMAPGVTTLTNVPNIADVHVMGKVLKALGAKIDVLDEHTLAIDTSAVDKWETPYSLVSQMRASTAVMGPLISRFGKAIVAMPGGCNIGARKIDMHILGLEALGVHFEIDHDLMMASVFAKGTTVIDNAAREPEIVDLANMLNEMGACIKGAGSPLIEIEGVSELHPVTHRVVGDRIEAGTFAAIGAIAGGPVTVKGSDPVHLGLVLKKFDQMGIDITYEEDGITVSRTADLTPVDIQTLPFPGFPTDMQAQTMALLALAKGSCVVTENVFENRFMFASEIQRMGANITIEGHHAIVRGVPAYSGAEVQASDLRAGAALVIAGLVADGTTVVSNIHHIDRGYEKFVEKLQSLGAVARRTTRPDEDVFAD